MNLLRLLIPQSLERRITVATALSVMVTILGFGTYTAVEQSKLLRAMTTAQMAATAQNLATVNASFLAARDLASIEAVALQTATLPGITSVLVTDLRGKPMSEVVYTNGNWTAQYRIGVVPIPGGDRAVQIAQPDGGTMDVWQPIAGGSPLGWVRVSYHTDELAMATRQVWVTALQVMAASIAFAVLLVYLLVHPAMRALTVATAFAENLDSSMGGQMTVGAGGLEVRALGQALNNVSTRLFKQNQDLVNQQFALDQHAIVSVADLDGRIVYANDRLCAISGYERSELLGSSHRLMRSGVHSHIFYADLWQCVCSGKVWHGVICNRAKGGSLYWVDATIVPLVDLHGLPMQYIAIHTDITAIKTLQDSLQEAKRVADTANHAKSEFLANMSHEIRTPLNGVIGMTQLALEVAQDETQRNYLEVAQSSAKSLLVLLNDILDLSKIEAGRLSIEHVAFNPHEWITHLLQPIEGRIKQKGLRLEVHFGVGLPGAIVGDPGRIRQVLTNLCDNAIKFTEHGGIDVWVSSRLTDTQMCELTFRVQDTGIGIPQDKQAQIFAAFSQADASTTRQYGGTGLGLTICSRLVELMGGSLGVQSEPDQGSCFFFSVLVPVATSVQLDDRPRDPSMTFEGVSAQRPLRVLLVEDHKVNQLLASTLLKRWGHSYVLAQNGREAVDLFSSGRWDVVLMDMQMPVMGGVEATRLIRDREPLGQHTPIIAVTANAMEAERQACIEAGMDDHLSKPIDAQALKQLLARHCP